MLMPANKSLRSLALALVAIALIVSACGPDADVATGDALGFVADRAASADFLRSYETLEELTTLISESNDGGEGSPSMIVVGTVTAVEPGRGAFWSEGGTKRTIVPFSDPASWSNTVHLTIDVTETVVPHAQKHPSQLTVGLAVGTKLTVDQVRMDYLSLGKVVFFLTKSPVFDYEAGLWGIYEDGLLMGVVDDGDNLTFPLIRKGDPVLPAGAISLDRIRAARVSDAS